MTFKAFQTVLAHRKCRRGDNVPHILFLHKPSDYTPCLHCQEERKDLRPTKRSECVPCGHHGRLPTRMHRDIHKVYHSKKLKAT